MKLATGKTIIIAVVCVLVAAAVIAALLFGTNTYTTQQKETSSGSTAFPSTTPSATGNGELGNTVTGQGPEPADGKKVLNVYSYDDELEMVIGKYIKLHPEFDYEVNFVYLPLVDEYITLSLINQNLPGDAEAVVDIYSVPGAYASHFIKGEMSDYACTYKELGIDVEEALNKADIPQYVIDAGTNPDGELIALPYKPYANVFVYRRSIAKEVFGTDYPDKIAEIIGGGSESWDKFREAAQTLKQHGYYIVPGCDDLSVMFDNSIYVSDAAMGVNPAWEEFMELSKAFYDQGFIADIKSSQEWDMYLNGKGDKQAFGFFIILDAIDAGRIDFFVGDTHNDWAICIPPFKTADNTMTGIMVNRNSPHKDVLGPLIEWITLDCSENGLQYHMATDTFFNQGDDRSLYEPYGRHRLVVSGSVLQNTSTCLDHLGGQNVNPVIYEALRTPSRMTYSGAIPQRRLFNLWLEETQAYIRGEKSRDAAIRDYLKRAEEEKAWLEETFEKYVMSHLLP